MKTKKKVQAPKQSQAEKRAEAIQVVRAKAVASAIEFFHDPQRKAFATVPVAAHRETWKVRSRDFRLWVMQILYDQLGAAPKNMIAAVLEEFETHAICEGKEFDVHVRIAAHGDATYIDLVNDRWQVLEVTADGWRILDDSPVKFRRVMGMTALPYPKTGGTFRDISRFLNVGTRSEVLLLAWLTYALRPNNPYPIVALSGVQGAGKSTITRVLRSLIDPSLAALTTVPKSERDVAIAASNSHLIAMDNLSEISAALSDILCRVATGGSFRTRELYTNDDETIFTYRRPLIINGIEELPIRPDLLDRSILIHIEPISEERRRDEQNFWQDFETVRPQLLGRMLDVICEGIRRLPAVKLAASPRMADFARWGVAVEQAMGFEPGTFLSAYQSNREDAHVAAIESSPIVSAVYHYLGSGKEVSYGKLTPPRITFFGSPTTLLKELYAFLGARAMYCDSGAASNGHPELEILLKHPKFPKSANQLSAEIARIEPTLKKMNITLERGRTHIGRYLKLKRIDIEAPKTPAQYRADQNAVGMDAAEEEVQHAIHHFLRIDDLDIEIKGQSPSKVHIILSHKNGMSETLVAQLHGMVAALQEAGWQALASVVKVIRYCKSVEGVRTAPTKFTVVAKRADGTITQPTIDTPQVAVEVGP